MGLPSVEEVVRRVRHPSFLADVVTRISGGDTSNGVYALDVCNLGENARSVAVNSPEQQPGHRTGIWRGAIDNRPDDIAAAVAFPGGTGIVNADDSVSPTAGIEHRLGPLEDPTGAVPPPDLHAFCVRMEVNLV